MKNFQNEFYVEIPRKQNFFFLRQVDNEKYNLQKKQFIEKENCLDKIITSMEKKLSDFNSFNTTSNFGINFSPFKTPITSLLGLTTRKEFIESSERHFFSDWVTVSIVLNGDVGSK